MELNEWIEWLKARIPSLKEKQNEFWIKQAMQEYADDYHQNEINKSDKSSVIGSLPIIYVKQGDSTHGKDSNGKEYFIKHVDNDL